MTVTSRSCHVSPPGTRVRLRVSRPSARRVTRASLEVARDLLHDLILPAKDVRVVLLEAPHACEAVERARVLVPAWRGCRVGRPNLLQMARLGSHGLTSKDSCPAIDVHPS